jgi:hypothetical protein
MQVIIYHFLLSETIRYEREESIEVPPNCGKKCTIEPLWMPL